MKKILFLLAFLPFIANAQPYPNYQGAATQANMYNGTLGALRGIKLPHLDSSKNYNWYSDIYIDKQTGKLMYRDSVSGSDKEVADVSSVLGKDSAVFVGTLAQVRSMQQFAPPAIILTDYGGGTFIKNDTVTVDNTGTQIKTASGQGYSRLYDGDIWGEWWIQNPKDTLTDYSAQIQQAIEFTFAQQKQITPRVPGLGLYTNTPWLKFNGNSRYVVNGGITIYAGMKVDFNNATLKCTQATDYIVTTPDDGRVSTAGYSFGQKYMRIQNLTIDGSGLARKGIVLKTTATSAFRDIDISRVTGSKWSRGTYTVASDNIIDTLTFNVNATTGIATNDAFMIWRPSENRYLWGGYIVDSLTANTVTVFGGLSEPVKIGDELEYFAAAWTSTSNQIEMDNVVCKNNSLGFAFARNRTNVGYDDNLISNCFAANGKIGVIANHLERTKILQPTFQRNSISNLIMVDCDQVNIDTWYNEVTGGSTDTTENFLGINNDNYATAYIENDRGIINVAIPTNNSIGWYRSMVLSGRNLKVIYQASFGSALENPAKAGDFAKIKLLSKKQLSTLDVDLMGISTLSQDQRLYQLVINDTFGFPIDRCVIKGKDYITGEAISVGSATIGAGSTLNFKINSKPRSQLTLGGGIGGDITFSDGAATPNSFKLSYAGTDSLKIDAPKFAVQGKLFINSLDGYIANGVLNSGTNIDLPAGYYSFYYPKNAAFRVGYTNGLTFDHALIGTLSFGIGNNVTASGLRAIAMGDSTQATGQTSFAWGVQSTASGTNALVLGRNNVASGTASTVIGSYGTASTNGVTILTDNSGTGVITTAATHKLVGSYLNGYDLWTGTRNSNNGFRLLSSGITWSNWKANLPAIIPDSMLVTYGLMVDSTYKKPQINALLVAKIDTGAVYPKAQSDSKYEVLTNKSTATGLGTSNTLYSTQGAVKTYVDSLHALQAVKLTATQVIDFPSLTATTEGAGVNVTVTGALTTDNAIVNISTTNEVGILYKAVVTATNTVTIYPLNITVNSIDPASATFKVMVLR